MAEHRSFRDLFLITALFSIILVVAVYRKTNFNPMEIRLTPKIPVKDIQLWRYIVWMAALIMVAVATFTLFGDPIGGVANSLSVAVPFAYFLFYRTETPSITAEINLGISLALKRSLKFGIYGALAAAVTNFAFRCIFQSPRDGVINAALSLCLINSVFAFGGAQVAQHWALRLALSFHRVLPLDVGSFLVAAERLKILKRIGTSYRFFHSYAYKYFAAAPKSIELRRVD